MPATVTISRASPRARKMRQRKRTLVASADVRMIKRMLPHGG